MAKLLRGCHNWDGAEGRLKDHWLSLQILDEYANEALTKHLMPLLGLWPLPKSRA